MRSRRREVVLQTARHNAEGQFGLAKMYENGQGVGSGLPIAIRWYQKAIDFGHKMAKQTCNA